MPERTTSPDGEPPDRADTPSADEHPTVAQPSTSDSPAPPPPASAPPEAESAAPPPYVAPPPVAAAPVVAAPQRRFGWAPGRAVPLVAVGLAGLVLGGVLGAGAVAVAGWHGHHGPGAGPGWDRRGDDRGHHRVEPRDRPGR